MQINCSLSSVTFSCDHIPGIYQHPSLHHPVFNLPQKRLLILATKQNLPLEDRYLIFLALLKSTDLLSFSGPASRIPATDAIIAQHTSRLISIIPRIHSIPSHEEKFPHIHIFKETCNLTEAGDWITLWNSRYHEIKSGYVSASESHKLIQRETALLRLLRGGTKDPSAYAQDIADWAALAGSFPTFLTRNPFTKTETTLSKFWQEIIVRAYKNHSLFSLTRQDFNELLDHIQEHIPYGTLHFHSLIQTLEKALHRVGTYLSTGETDIPRIQPGVGASTYKILPSNPADLPIHQNPNITALVSAAPEKLPLREEYPSEFKYLQAKLRWDLAVKNGTRKNP